MQLATYGSEEVPLDAALLELVASGAWGLERERLASGLAAVGAGGDAPASQLKAAEESFRRQRGLLAAEDLTAWLTARELSVADLRAHLRLGLAGPHGDRSATTVPVPALREAARRAVLLDGLATEAARRLMLGAAALDVGGSEVPVATSEQAAALAAQARADPALPLEQDGTDSQLEQLAARVVRLRSALAGAVHQLPEGEVEEVLQENWAQWTRLRYSELTLPTERAAREALLCVTEDHLDLEEVAHLAGAPLRRVDCRAAEVGPPLGTELLSTAPGGAIGPLQGHNGWSVAVLHERTATSLEDPVARQQAVDITVRRRLERRLAGRVRWHAAAL